jgi:hypothetical protein
MLGIVNILGSLLSYGLGHIKSNLLYSYQIIFLFCGLLTVVTSVFVFIFMVSLLLLEAVFALTESFSPIVRWKLKTASSMITTS